MKLNKILFLILAMLNHLVVYSAKLKCWYGAAKWPIVGDLYSCGVNDNGIFNGIRVTFDSIEGQHMPGKTNDDVKGINIHTISKVSFFPVSIEKYFKNLIAINIWKSQLVEINSNDLQPFANLEILLLGENKIKVIEKDTFKYNPQLKVIYLGNNEISHFDNRAFDGLDHLIQLDMSGNNCKKSMSFANTRLKSLEIIQQIENDNCIDFNELIRKVMNTATGKVNLKIKELNTHSEIIQKSTTNEFNSVKESVKKSNDNLRDAVVKINQMSKNNQNLMRENQGLNEQIIGLKNEMQAQVQIIRKEIENERRADQAEMNSMKIKLENLTQNKQELSEKLKIANQDIQIVIASYHQLNNEINALKSTIRKDKDEIKSIEDNMRQLKEETKDSIVIIKDFSDYQSTTNKEIIALKASLVNSTQNIQEIKSEVSFLKTKDAELSTKMQDNKKEMQAQIQPLRNELKKESENLKKSIDAVKKLTTNNNQDLNKKLQAVTQKIDNQTKESQAFKSQVSILKTKHDELIVIVQDYKTKTQLQIQTVTEKNINMKSEINVIKSDLASLTLSFSDELATLTETLEYRSQALKNDKLEMNKKKLTELKTIVRM